MFGSKGLRGQIKMHRSTEEGSASIEFVILFPLIIGIFLMGFEAGYYLLRSVMLDRAVDLAAREVRLGNESAKDYHSLKSVICGHSLTIPNCNELLQVELRPLTTSGVAPLGPDTKCIDTKSAEDPADHTLYVTGAGNQWMVLRVCALSQPLFPTTVLASGMVVDSDGNFAFVSKSGWVNEPEDGTMNNPDGSSDYWEEDTPPEEDPVDDPVDDDGDDTSTDPVEEEEEPLVIPDVPVLEEQG